MVTRPRVRELARLSAQVRRGGRAPGRSENACGSEPLSVHDEERSARQLSVRHVRRAAGAHLAHPRFVRHDGQADGGRLYRAGHRYLGGPRRTLDPRGGRAAGRQGACELRLPPLHGRPGRALRRRAGRADGDPVRRRPDRKAGATDPGLPARHHHGDAQLHAVDRRRNGTSAPRLPPSARCESASSARNRGPTTCVSQSSSAWASTPSTSMGSPR